MTQEQNIFWRWSILHPHNLFFVGYVRGLKSAGDERSIIDIATEFMNSYNLMDLSPEYLANNYYRSSKLLKKLSEIGNKNGHIKA